MISGFAVSSHFIYANTQAGRWSTENHLIADVWGNYSQMWVC